MIANSRFDTVPVRGNIVRNGPPSNAPSSLRDPVNLLRGFITERPGTALLAGIAIGGLIGWALKRMK